MTTLQKQILAVLKGFRNGLEYGSKVRFVHTLVMTLLFKDIKLINLPNLIKTIFAMALEHGINLGTFVLTYKCGYKMLDQLVGKKSVNHFLSGLVFGVLIFGKKTGVSNQIVLYLFSRVIIGLMALFYAKIGEGYGKKWKWIENGYGYYLLSAVCWGTVMWLFQKDKTVLQPSLSHSMEFLYKQSDKVSNWTEMIPYYPKQKKRRRKQSLQMAKKSQHKHK